MINYDHVTAGNCQTIDIVDVLPALRDAESLQILLSDNHSDSGSGFLSLIEENFHLYLSLYLSVCCCSQTAGHNSCSIVSGDLSNCSY